MYANARLVAEFDQLTAPLRRSDGDLPGSVRRFEEIAAGAVPSLLGWSLAVRVDVADVSVMAIDPWTKYGDIRASLGLSVSAYFTAGLDGRLVFYATEPHAFRHLAANLDPSLGLDVSRLRIDQDLHPNPTAGVRGVREMASINRVIALLIAGGGTADTARDFLQATARFKRLTLRQSAEDLLTQLTAEVAAGRGPLTGPLFGGL